MATIVDYVGGLVLPDTPETDLPAALAPAAMLARFRRDYYRLLTARADALFELTEAVLCADGPVTSLVELSLTAEHRRGHGALYDALNSGHVDVGRLRVRLAGLPLPRAADERIVLAVDVSNWLRPDASTSPERLFCHVYGRAKGQAQMIPGWPYSFVAALEPGRTSWTAMWTAILDAQRLGPADDATAVTAAQLRDVVGRLIAAGHWRDGDPRILIVADTGYDITRLAFVLADLPVYLLGRLRTDRVLRLPKPPRAPATNGRPPQTRARIRLDNAGTWPAPQHHTSTETTRYGTAEASSWDRLHPTLTRRTCWIDHTGDLPVIEGTLDPATGRTPARRAQPQARMAGCSWWKLPEAIFGVTRATTHRRFAEWTQAGLWERLHQAVLDRLGAAGHLDWSRAVVDSISVRAEKKGA